MIYTYGYAPTYDPAIERSTIDGNPMKKLGKSDEIDGTPYFGGAVWKTSEEAYQYIDYLYNTQKYPNIDDLACYSIDGSWNDVYYINGEMFHRLSVDKNIIKKIIRK